MFDDILGAIAEALGSFTQKWRKLSTINRISNIAFTLLMIFIVIAAIYNNSK